MNREKDLMMATKKTGEVAVKKQQKSLINAQQAKKEKMKKDENMALLGTSPVANAAVVIEKYGKPFGELDWPSVGEVIFQFCKTGPRRGHEPGGRNAVDAGICDAVHFHELFQTGLGAAIPEAHGKFLSHGD